MAGAALQQMLCGYKLIIVKDIAPRGLQMRCALILLLAGLLLAGCVVVRGVDYRKQERMSAYMALPPEMRQAVDLGQLKVGMNSDAVYIAWGKPSQIISGGNATEETTTWLYRTGYIQQSTFWGPYREHTAYTTMTYTRAQVTFVNGAVREWQTYPSPVY
jgi:hypothetical protein